MSEANNGSMDVSLECSFQTQLKCKVYSLVSKAILTILLTIIPYSLGSDRFKGLGVKLLNMHETWVQHLAPKRKKMTTWVQILIWPFSVMEYREENARPILSLCFCISQMSITFIGVSANMGEEPEAVRITNRHMGFSLLLVEIPMKAKPGKFRLKRPKHYLHGHL